jgi:hypothetical protein
MSATHNKIRDILQSEYSFKNYIDLRDNASIIYFEDIQSKNSDSFMRKYLISEILQEANKSPVCEISMKLLVSRVIARSGINMSSDEYENFMEIIKKNLRIEICVDRLRLKCECK